MTTTKKPEQEHTEASPPKPPAAPAQGDMQSINEPPGSEVKPTSPADDSHEKSPQATDVSRETDHGNKRHR